jgi:hypothetical protein
MEGAASSYTAPHHGPSLMFKAALPHSSTTVCYAVTHFREQTLWVSDDQQID